MNLEFCGQRPPQLVVGETHNILVGTESLFTAGGLHIYLWLEATRLSKSHVPKKIGTYGQLSNAYVSSNGQNFKGTFNELAKKIAYSAIMRQTSQSLSYFINFYFALFFGGFEWY